VHQEGVGEKRDLFFDQGTDLKSVPWMFKFSRYQLVAMSADMPINQNS
jgi:hypothetical protein